MRKNSLNYCRGKIADIILNKKCINEKNQSKVHLINYGFLTNNISYNEVNL